MSHANHKTARIEELPLFCEAQSLAMLFLERSNPQFLA